MKKPLYYFLGIAPILYIAYLVYRDMLQVISTLESMPPGTADQWILNAVGVVLLLILTFIVFNVMRQRISFRKKLIGYAILLGIVSGGISFAIGPDLSVIAIALALPIWTLILSFIAPMASAPIVLSK